MYTLAIVNQKGGVGKTTTAVTVAHGLALAGKSVLLVDLDAQGNCADALGLKKGPGLYNLLIERNVKTAVQETGRARLHLIASDKQTVEVKAILTGRGFRETALKRALFDLSGYDVAVLDVAPGVDILQIAAMVACDGFIIPTALAHLSAVGVMSIFDLLAELRESGACQGECIGVLPTFWEGVTRESFNQLRELATVFQDKALPFIPTDVKAKEAARAGKTLWEYTPQSRVMCGIMLNNKLWGGYRQVLSRIQYI